MELEHHSKNNKYEVPHIMFGSLAPKREKGKKFAKECHSKNKKIEVAKRKVGSTKGKPLTEQQKSKKFRKGCVIVHSFVLKASSSRNNNEVDDVLRMHPYRNKALLVNIDNDVATDMDPELMK